MSPIYEYQCPSCRRISEVLQKYGDPFPKCGDCEVKGLPCEMQRGISQTSFILKGGGWSSTGYTKKK